VFIFDTTRCRASARAWSLTWCAVASIATALIATATFAAPGAIARSTPVAHIAVIPRSTPVAHIAVTHHSLSHQNLKAHAASGCANANTPAVAASNNEMRNAVVCLVNQQRAGRHLPRLHANPRLDRSAQGWTNAMVARSAFTHGSDFSARITAVGFVWSAAAENIATGYPTPRAVVNGWMASTGHCANILSPTYLDVGTGLSRHPVRGFASGEATWTQDFGLPMGHHASSGNFSAANHCPY
jgi:uncharacterized protein YkwD